MGDRTVGDDEVAAGLGLNALEGGWRGDDRAGQRHRFEHLVLDAAGYTKRRHDHIGVTEPAADIGHGPGHDDITPLPQTLHLIRPVAPDHSEMRLWPGLSVQRKYGPPGRSDRSGVK